MQSEHLRFAPEILERLGEELVPHADLGILELVRNAYDADASFCKVSLRDVDAAGGVLIVEDDGDGMTAEDIRTGWLLLGKSGKKSSRYTRAGRRKVGEKGLGRLAALRLGQAVDLVTTHDGTRSGSSVTQSSLTIEWNRFDGAEAVEDVALAVQTHPSEPPTGTTIQVTNLRKPMSKTDVRRLARSMVLLTGPFPAPNTFRAILDAPDFSEMEELVLNGYFDEHEYKVVASVNESGSACAKLVDWTGRTIASAQHDELAGNGPYLCPPAEFELWVFNLSKSSFDVRQSKKTVSAVQTWLREVGGVHLFQRGLRVHPYGDPGHDWLDMNLRRARSPELRPSTNTAVGRVVVSDDGDMLTPKTDRTGFLETDAFVDLRRFGGDVLDWAAEERRRIRDREREGQRKKDRLAVERASKKIAKTLDEVPDQVRPQVERAIEEYQAAFDRQLRSTEDDLLLYRTLGTVGTVTAVFAHETLRPVATIQQMASSLQIRTRKVVDDDTYEQTFAPPLDRILSSTASLRTFAELPLHMLSRNKRRRRTIDVVRVAREVIQSFSPYLEDSGVAADVVADDERALVSGTQASLEAVFANLLANSVYFLGQAQGVSTKRVVVTVGTSNKNVLVTVADDGPGIVGVSPKDVWLPGRSTRDEGTGLGLTIVRDAVREMGGSATAIANGELGGAEFRVVLPRAAEESHPPLPGLEEGWR